MKRVVFLLIPAVLLVVWGCTSRADTELDPRKVVLNFLRAMEKSDTTAVAHYLDFETLLTQIGKDYELLPDKPRMFYDPQELVNELVAGGLTHTRWMSMQKIVNKSAEANDSALVEVSFMDKDSRTQYYNKFGLRRINEAWKIYSFSVKER
jgi:hypothetical protein